MTTAMYRSRDLRRLTSLWVAVDAGDLTLPDDIAALRTAHRQATDQAAAITAPDGPGTQAELVDIVMTAAVNGDRLPDLVVIADGFSRRQAAAALATAARTTIDTLEDRLIGATLGVADELVQHHLAPFHAEIIGDLRRVAAVLTGHDLDPATLLGAPVRVREARIELDHVVNRYVNLRAIYGALGPALDVHLDTAGKFAEMQNYTDVVGSNDPIGNPRTPWPDDPAARLLWLLSHDARLWMPTAEQRDDAFRAAYPDAPAVKGYNPLAVTVGA